MDDYGLRNLVWHLLLAARCEDIVTLVNDSDWLRHKLVLDPTRRTIADDLEVAIRCAEAQGPAGLVDFVTFNLMVGLIGSLATNLDPEALALMAALGEGEQAYAYTSLFVDPIKRVETLTRLAEEHELIADGQTARRLLSEARSLALNLPVGNERDRATVFAALGFGVIGAEGEGTMLLAEVGSLELRERGTTQIVATLARRGHWMSAFELCAQLTLPQHAISAYAEICRQAEKERRVDLAAQARQGLLRWYSQFSPQGHVVEAVSVVVRALFLAGEHELAWRLAGELPPLWIGRVIRWILRVDDPSLANVLFEQLSPETQNAMELSDLAMLYMANGQVTKSLETAASIIKQRPQDGAFGALISQFAAHGDIEQALAIVPHIRGPAVRIWSLAMIGQAMASRGDHSGARRMLDALLHEAVTAEASSLQETFAAMARSLAEAGELDHALLIGPDSDADATKLVIASVESALAAGEFSQAAALIDSITGNDQRTVLQGRLVAGLCQTGAVDQAKRLFPTLTANEQAQAAILIARAYAQQAGRMEEGLAFAASLVPRAVQDEALRELALARIREQDYEAALTVVARMSTGRVQAQARSELATAMAHNGYIHQALAQCGCIVPEDIQARAYANLAPLVYDHADQELVQVCLSRCRGTRHHRTAVAIVAGKLYLDGHRPEAVAQVEALPDDQHQSAWLGLARFLLGAGGLVDLPDDLACIIEAKGLDVLQTLVSAHIAAGRFDEVVPLLPKLTDPKVRFTATQRVVQYLAGKGQVAAAVDLVLTSVHPGAQSDALMEIASTAGAQGDFATMFRLIDQIRSGPRRGEAWRHLADVLRGRHARADAETIAIVCQAFQIARSKGQQDVLDCLAALSPVIVRLLPSVALCDLRERLTQVRSVFLSEPFAKPGTLA
jgi:tetratricopeptide (TPR) repeat protein